MLCQAVFSKMDIDPIPDELKDLNKIRKKINFLENISRNGNHAWKKKEELQKLRVVFVISPLQQQTYATFSQDLWIQAD